LVQITHFIKNLGFEGPLNSLHSPEDNPINRWHRVITLGQDVAAEGNREARMRELEVVLAEMEGVKGNMVDKLRPKVLGMISVNHFNDGRIDQA